MKRIMVLAHREELIFQAAAHARRAGLRAGIEMAHHRAGNEEVVISTIQSLNATRKCPECIGAGCVLCGEKGRVKRMTKFRPDDFGLVIIDEAHHATAKTYRNVLTYFQQNPGLKVLLVTATPKRTDKIGLHNVCESVAYEEMDIRQAIAEGWLTPIRNRIVNVKGLHLAQVKTKAGGDLADGELERAFLGYSDIQEERLLHRVAKPTLDEAKGDPTLVFAAGREHARKLTAAFNAYDGVTAELVLGNTDKQERRAIIDRYQRRQTQVLVGVGVFNEGFDAPGTVVVAIARPTKSTSLYMQMIGRGTRPLPGVVDGLETAEERRQAIAESGKPHCIVLDFVGDSGRHKLISMGDILAGEDVEPVDLEEALKLARKESEPVDIEELIEKAKQAREEAEKRAAERRRILQTRHRAERAEYTASDIDLFGPNFNPFTDYHPARDQATQKQVNYLMKLGVSPAEATRYTKRQAGIVIDRLTKKTGGDFVLTFGKYQGRKLRDVPGKYRQWLKLNVPKKELQHAIRVLERNEL